MLEAVRKQVGNCHARLEKGRKDHLEKKGRRCHKKERTVKIPEEKNRVPEGNLGRSP